jgi:hypothetical protein
MDTQVFLHGETDDGVDSCGIISGARPLSAQCVHGAFCTKPHLEIEPMLTPFPDSELRPNFHSPRPRGVHCEFFADHLEYYSVTSWGERSLSVRCELDMLSVPDAIADLWDALERVDPRRLSGAERRAPAPALQLVEAVPLRLVARD